MSFSCEFECCQRVAELCGFAAVAVLALALAWCGRRLFGTETDTGDE